MDSEMTTAGELVARYRGYAVQCWNLAQAQDSASDKFVLIHMAQGWLALADCVKKSESLFVPAH